MFYPLDLKLNEQINALTKLQDALKGISIELGQESKAQIKEVESKIKELESKIVSCEKSTESSIRSQTVETNIKVEMMKDDMSKVHQEMNNIYNITSQMESLEESLERKIFKTVKDDLKKIEHSTKVANEETTKELKVGTYNPKMYHHVTVWEKFEIL